MRTFIVGLVIGVLLIVGVLHQYGYVSLKVGAKNNPAVKTSVARSMLAPPIEISGVTIDRERKDEKILVLVSDEVAGTYFACPDKQLASTITVTAPLTKYFEIADCLEYKIKGASKATDFESIAKAQSGEYLILSETLRALIVAHGETKTTTNYHWTEGLLKGQYYNSYGEVGGHGLEGIAIKITNDNKFHIAASWEGGYPEHKRVVDELGASPKNLHQNPINPIIVKSQDPVDMDGNELREFVRTCDTPPGNCRVVEEIQIQGEPASAFPGLETTIRPVTTQRFRTPDLVWNDGAGASGDIILLAASASDAQNSRPFSYTCLLEVSGVDGKIRNSLLIKDATSTNGVIDQLNNSALKSFGNWEALAWFDDDNLILVNDNDARLAPVALVVSGPSGWGSGTKCPVKEN